MSSDVGTGSVPDRPETEITLICFSCVILVMRTTLQRVFTNYNKVTLFIVNKALQVIPAIHSVWSSWYTKT